MFIEIFFFNVVQGIISWSFVHYLENTLYQDNFSIFIFQEGTENKIRISILTQVSCSEREKGIKLDCRDDFGQLTGG